MSNQSVYLFYPFLVLVLGTKDLKSAVLTSLISSILLFTSFLFKKILKNENLFFIRFFIFSLQVTLVSLLLGYFNFSWYLPVKYAAIMFYSVYIVVERVKICGKLCKIKYISETILLLIIIAALREFVAFGELFSFEIIKNYEGILMLNYTGGGLFVATIILELFNHIKGKEVKHVERNS